MEKKLTTLENAMFTEYGVYLVPHHRMNGDIINYWYSVSKLTKSAAGGVINGYVSMIEIGCHKTDYEARKIAIDKALERCIKNKKPL